MMKSLPILLTTIPVVPIPVFDGGVVENKEKVLKELERARPNDLSIGEVAERAKLSRPTASTWLKVLGAEGKAEVSRKIGAAVFYRLKKRSQ